MTVQGPVIPAAAASAPVPRESGSSPAPRAQSKLMPPPAPPATSIPWLGLVAVLMGTFISTLNGRLSNFGLADIRGAVGAGFDEGAWITTAQTSAQMFVALFAMWLGAVYGPRRVLVAASLGFAIVSLLTPFSSTLPILLVMQFASGLASGFFIPLTLSFVLRNMPPKFWAFGIALYALNLELSLHISASLEGYYIEHMSWHWIFWQNVPLALIMTICLRAGMSSAPPPAAQRPPLDFFGLFSGSVGLALIYAALDQGNRLDWLHSGLICALLVAGAILVIAFVLHERDTPFPILNLKVVLGRPIPSLMVMVSFLRLTILATAFLIPLYLGSVRGFRSLEVGETLVWVAAPQIIFCPLAALMLRRTDARIVACIGFIFISVACLMVAYRLTPIWGSVQFLPSQLLQAVGQSFALSGVIFFGILHLKPEDALTFGSVLQIARLMGGELGTAFITTWTRVREQVASNLIGQHVLVGDGQAMARLHAYGVATTRAFDPGGELARGRLVLSNVVRAAATTQSVMDGFVAIAFMTAVALLILVTRRAPPPGPASPPPLFPVAPARAA
jgi:MFS transporter, DHA2 family, multidrug resistance protein